MNLGDGLLFELDNGKPRLILLSHGSEKNPAKLSRPRAASVLSSTEVQSEERPTRRQAGRRRRETRSKAEGAAVSSTCNVAATVRSSSPLTSSSASTTRTNHMAEGSVKAASKVRSDRPSSSVLQSSRTNGKAGRLQVGLKDTEANGEPGLEEACLTSERLQQILNTVPTSDSSQQRPLEDRRTQGTDSNSPASSVNEIGGGGGGRRRGGEGIGTTVASQDKDNRSSGCLFSWLEDRDSDNRAAMEAKKAQWRRELDEQVALKQQQESAASRRLQAEEDTGSVLSVWSYNSHKEQHAAIRSNIRLGTEDHEHWTKHFDSLQRRPLPSTLPPAPFTLPPAPATLQPVPAVGPDKAEWEVAPSSSLSLVWEAMSSCGAESAGRASVDTTTGYTTRASYLRTMTALLDPAQIEERERRRIKQLEHQRAIEAQVEERRQQREREQVRRREEEQEEESRMALEREALQRQYRLDTLRGRQKEEELIRQKEELFQSVQKAQQEALKSRQQQRITELLRRGHDVSRLLPALELSAVKLGQCLEEEGGAGREEEVGGAGREEEVGGAGREEEVGGAGREEEVGGAGREEEVGGAGREDDIRRSVSLCKDTDAVQTAPSLLDRADFVQTPEVSAEYLRPAPPPPGDPYEAFARTKKSKRDKKKPEWNTQRPSQRFIPASERYPAVHQRTRQESRMRRQAELLALQDRNSRTDPAPPPPPQQQQEPRPNPNPGPNLGPNPKPGPNLGPGPNPYSNLGPNPVQTRTRASPTRKVDGVSRGQCVSSAERRCSPPVPAVRHRLQSQRCLASPSPPPPPLPPPILEFVPYVRTDEVFNLDPLEPINTPLPHTHTAPQRSPPPPPAASQQDLLHPELLRNTHTHKHRQQEILRGLAQLRQVTDTTLMSVTLGTTESPQGDGHQPQTVTDINVVSSPWGPQRVTKGLLQKQRELESGPNPLLKLHSSNTCDL